MVKEIKSYLLHKRVARARAAVKAHARFTLRLRRMRGFWRFRQLSGMMGKAARAICTLDWVGWCMCVCVRV